MSTSVRSTAAALLGLLLASAPAGAQELLQMTTARQVSGEEAVEMQVRYAAGRLTVEAAEPGLLYQARLRYLAGRFEPLKSYELTDGTARVRLGLRSGEGEGANSDWSDLDELNLSLDELGGRGADEGRLVVGLSREIPTALKVEAGATESTFRLGGLPLTRFTVETGASETEITFDEPNPAVMERLEIRLGAASLEARQLGNAAAETIVVEGAVGEATLDFTGRWTRDAEARVKMGLGSLTLRIPENLGVRIHKRGLLTSFSGLGLRKADDGSYRTPDWESAEHRLDLTVDAAFGNVEVEVVE